MLGYSEFLSFISASIGAVIGVLAAQWFAERNLRKTQLLKAISQANALIALATIVVNNASTTKKQVVTPLSEKYFNSKIAVEKLNKLRLRGDKISQLMNFEPQMLKIPPVKLPIEALKNITYSADLIPGKAIAIVSMIDDSLAQVVFVIDIYNEQCNYFKSHIYDTAPMNNRVQNEVLIQDYFGLERENGVIDLTHHDCIVGMKTYIDDLIFFGVELANDIQAHAARLQIKLKDISLDVPKISTVDFSHAHRLGLIPPRKDYEDWLQGFDSTD